jgi:hypothetical protein
VPVAAGLGGQQPHHAVLGQRAQGVDERVDEVAVAVAPPQQHMVHHLVGVLVNEVTDPVQQQVPEIVVHVVVVADLHDDHARLDPEPVRPGYVPPSAWPAVALTSRCLLLMSPRPMGRSMR